MKKTLLTLSAAACVFAANAQVSIIPKAGISLANVAYQEEDNKEEGQKSNLGLVAGLGFNLGVSEVFSIQPELLYIQKGFGVKNTETENFGGANTSVTYKGKQTINYLELPVLAKVSFGGETFKAYINAGPSFGFGLNGKTKAEITEFTVNGQDQLGQLEDDERKSEYKIKFAEEPEDGGDDDVDYYDPKYYNRLDLGIQFGGGIGVQAGPGMLMLDARYGLGMSNFMKKDDDIDLKADGKNRAFALTVGYAIPLGGN